MMRHHTADTALSSLVIKSCGSHPADSLLTPRRCRNSR